MRTLTTLALSLFICASTFNTADTAENERKKERHTIGGTAVPLTTRQELTFKGARSDADVRTRELWFRRNQGTGQQNNWGAWEKHPLDFGPQTPITWAPPEGHWQIYTRIIEISGNAQDIPTASTAKSKIKSEFIVDRSAPSVALLTPKNGEILRTKQAFTITWTATDANLHSTAIDLYWSRTGSSEEILIASGLSNTGSYNWTTPADMANEARVIIKASDKVLNTGSAQTTNIIIDGAAPQRNILGPKTSMTQSLTLDTRVFDVGPAKQLAGMQLWYSSDNGVNWSQGPSASGNNFTTLAWTAPNDGQYMLTLVTSDIAGNKNAVPTSRHDAIANILVDSANPDIQLASTIGVQEPNAGKESSRRTFKPQDSVVIAYTIQDMQLADTPVSIFFRNAADAPWESIATGLASDSSFTYTLPNVNSRNCRIKVEAIDACGNIGSIISSEDFTIDNKVEDSDVTVDFD